MMQRLLFQFLIFGFLFLTACHHSTPEQKALLVRADSLMEHHADSALYLLKRIHNYKDLASADRALYALLMSQALDKNDIWVESDSLIRIATDYYETGEPLRAGYAWFYLSRCERNRGNAQGQAETLLKALNFATKSNNFKLLGFVYSEKAIIFTSQSETDSTLYYHKLALQALQKAGDKRNCVICLINIGYSHYRNHQYDNALVYYQQAEKEAIPLQEPLLLSTIYRQTGLTLYCKKDYSKALFYTKLAATTSDIYDYSKWINFAMIYDKLDKLDSVHFYLHKCSNPHEMASEYYQLLQDVNIKEGNIQNALYYANRLTVARDSLNKRVLSDSFAGLEKKYNYARYVDENKSLIIRDQRKSLLILGLLLLLSMIITIVAMHMYSQKKRQLEQQLLLTTKEEALVRKEQEKSSLLKKQLEMQQKTLLNINAQKKETISQSKADLENRKSPDKADKLESKEQDITVLYQEIIQNVDDLHNHISLRLATQFPKLTSSDILLCCLLLAGFDSASISSLFDIQPKSYNMRRTILRKRLNLSHEIDLVYFLAKF